MTLKNSKISIMIKMKGIARVSLRETEIRLCEVSQGYLKESKGASYERYVETVYRHSF